MKPAGLTPKQKRILDFITTYYEDHGYAPLLSEIAKNFKKSVPTIHQYIEALEKKGHLNKEEGSWRGITPQSGKDKIFLLGYIAAGKPIEPIENPEPIEIPSSMIVSPGSYFALKVKGDSMIEDGVVDGDTIVVKHQKTAENGDTVVAITENGATLKVFKKQNKEIILEPRNKNYPVIEPKELDIRGKFVGLIRSE